MRGERSGDDVEGGDTRPCGPEMKFPGDFGKKGRRQV